jgi:hypothetical protein
VAMGLNGVVFKLIATLSVLLNMSEPDAFVAGRCNRGVPFWVFDRSTVGHFVNISPSAMLRTLCAEFAG